MTTTLSQNPSADQPGTPRPAHSSPRRCDSTSHRSWTTTTHKSWRSKCPGSRSCCGHGRVLASRPWSAQMVGPTCLATRRPARQRYHCLVISLRLPLTLEPVPSHLKAWRTKHAIGLRQSATAGVASARGLPVSSRDGWVGCEPAADGSRHRAGSVPDVQPDRRPGGGRAAGASIHWSAGRADWRPMAHLWHTRVQKAVQQGQPASTNHARNGGSPTF